MKSVCLHGTANLQTHDEPIPVPGVGEKLIRVKSVGICGSDLRWFSEGEIGDAKLRHPLVLGHEFAAVGKEIPCVLTAMGDEFGGPIPCGGFALIGDEAIGKVVVESIGNSPAVLLKNHGVFTIGKDATAAVKTAVMTEDVAATVWMAMQIGTPDTIPQEDVDKLHECYTNVNRQ